MRSKLFASTAAAAIGFGLAGAPYAFAQDTTPPAEQNDMQMTPATPTQPAPDATNDGMAPPVNSAPPAEIAPPADTAATGDDSLNQTLAVTGNMQPAGTLLGEDIKGADVVGPEGDDVASVSDYVVDSNQGQIVGAILNVGGVLGVGGKDVLVAWSDLTIGADGETVSIAKSAEELDQMPAFQPLAEPEDVGATAPAAPAAPTQ